MRWRHLLWLVVSGLATLNAQSGPGYDLNDRGNEAALRGDFPEAQKLHRAALEVWRGMGPSYDAYAANSLVNLGQAYVGEGKWREAESAFEEALVLDRRSLGIKNLRTLAALNGLGNSCLALRRLECAEQAFAEALPIEQELYPQDAQLAHTLSGMAALKSLAGKPDEALPLAQQALSLGIAAEGEKSVPVASMYANVAQIHDSAGRPARAIPLFRKARAIYEQAFGADSPVTATLLSAEGLALMGDGNLGLADQQLQRAVELLAGRPDYRLALAVAKSNLGLLRMRQRRYLQADDLLTNALAIEEQFSPGPVTDMAVTMEVLAQLREKQKRPVDAQVLRQRAESIRAFR